MIEFSETDWTALQDATSSIYREENARNFPNGFAQAIIDILEPVEEIVPPVLLGTLFQDGKATQNVYDFPRVLSAFAETREGVAKIERRRINGCSSTWMAFNNGDLLIVYPAYPIGKES